MIELEPDNIISKEKCAIIFEFNIVLKDILSTLAIAITRLPTFIITLNGSVHS